MSDVTIPFAHGASDWSNPFAIIVCCLVCPISIRQPPFAPYFYIMTKGISGLWHSCWNASQWSQIIVDVHRRHRVSWFLLGLQSLLVGGPRMQYLPFYQIGVYC